MNDSRVPLEAVNHVISFPPGQGGLATLRLVFHVEGRYRPLGDKELSVYYRNDNYKERPGWKGVVLQAGTGVFISRSTVPSQDRSNELRDFPQGMLDTPANETEAPAVATLSGSSVGGGASAVEPADTGHPPADDFFTSLVTSENLSVSVVVISFVLALGLGGLHAMSPGHGKTVMAAFLIGTRGTAKHAVLLGLTVTASHTLGVLALGAVTLYTSTVIAPEKLYPWLGLISGLIIFAVGCWLLTARLRRNSREDHHHDHHGGHGGHDHQVSDGKSILKWKNLVAIGIANGIIPSASALIILLAAISMQRTEFGILLIVAFSAGMAAVPAGVGLLLVYAAKVINRIQSQNRLVGTANQLLPMATALVVLVSGSVFTARAFYQLGLS